MTPAVLELALESSADGFLAVDREFRVRFANAAARTLLAASGTQLEDLSLWELFPTISAILAREALASRREYSFDSPLEGWENVHVRIVPVGEQSRNIRAVIWLRPRDSFEHLAKRDSLGLLAGGIAHDFNNILTGILGYASLGLYSIEEGSEARPLIEEVVRAGERAAGLTRQLLAYAGKGRFMAAPTDLNQLAREISREAQTSLQNPNLSVTLELAEGLPEIHADSGQLGQVVHSLVMNGVEAIGEGNRGTILVATRLRTVAESTPLVAETGEPVTPGRYVVLEVKDTGSGMDALTRARIFEPFFTTKMTGRGMGLSAVLGIVRRHGGVLQVDSVPGVGSSFRVLLPAADSTVAKHAVPATDLEGAGLVLVVDDEETVRDTVRRALERWHYQVVLAENGQAAVEVFPQIADKVRAVILDLTMPVMGGEEALDHLQRIRPDVRIILTSGYSEREAMRRMEGKGVAAFLQKPFTAQQVGAKLRALFSELDGEGEPVGNRKK
jgi:signal transduction histidine kinase/ActR/RegA family two-component response regulator